MIDPMAWDVGCIPDTIPLGGADLTGVDMAGMSILNTDLNGDGVADVSEFALDLDGDGMADVSQVMADFDGDGIADAALTDLDGDGVPDVALMADAADKIWGDESTASDAAGLDVFDTLEAAHSDPAFPGHEAFFETHGYPDADVGLWDPQDDPMSCAVAVTNSMFRSLGLDPGESRIAEAFMEFGIYDPSGGTNFRVVDDAINIIAARAGLDVEARDFSGSSLPQLEAMLDAGVRPLIAVDGAELYEGSGERLLNDIGLLPDAPHAVQLTGIERTPEGDFAVINDPATGGGVRIPLNVFADAAEDFGFSGVAMSDHATIAGLGSQAGGGIVGSESGILGAAFGAQNVRADAFGNLYRGSSLVPFSGPGAPGWKHVGNTNVFQG